MLFNILLIIIIVSTTACGSGNSGSIGETLSESTPLYSSYGIQSQTTFVIDHPTQRILQINLGDMTITNAYKYAKAEQDHFLATNGTGSFVIDFSAKHLEIIRSNDDREERPFSFQGTPVSAAYNAKKGIFIMQDNLQSVGMMMLSENGKVQKSWLGGSLLEKGKSFLAGDVDSKGRLILTTSDHSAVVVDVESSINRNSWDFKSSTSAIQDANWLAPDNELGDLSLVTAKDSIVIFNSETRTVSERISLSERGLSIIGKSKLLKPHLVVLNETSGRKGLYYINAEGKLGFHELPTNDLPSYSASYLNEKGTELTVLSSNNNYDQVHQVLKLQLTNNLVTLSQKISSSGEAKLGADVLFINKKSPLGYLELHDLTKETKKELKGYNFDYFGEN